MKKSTWKERFSKFILAVFGLCISELRTVSVYDGV